MTGRREGSIHLPTTYFLCWLVITEQGSQRWSSRAVALHLGRNLSDGFSPGASVADTGSHQLQGNPSLQQSRCLQSLTTCIAT